MAAAVLVVAAGTARAAQLFARHPRAVGLNGAVFTADTIHFADYDLIVQAPGGKDVHGGGLFTHPGGLARGSGRDARRA